MPTRVQAAQAAMLGAFDHADTVTAEQLDAAAAGYSEATRNRARAGLTRGRIIDRGKRGMNGPVTYTRRWSTPRPKPKRISSSAAATTFTQHYTRDADYADEDDGAADYYDGAEDDDDDDDDDVGGWSWAIAIIVLCGVGGVIWARRRFGSFPTAAGTDRTPMPPYNPPPRPHYNPPPRRSSIVAPRPSDEAIFGPDPAPDETCDRNPIVRSTVYDRFATFPGLYDFRPQSDT